MDIAGISHPSIINTIITPSSRFTNNSLIYFIQPPEKRPLDTPWPTWPRIMRTSSSHDEGCTRRFSVMTKRLTGRGIHVSGLNGVEVKWEKTSNGFQPVEISGTEFSIKTDLVFIAMGFVHTEHKGLVKKLGLKLDSRGNIDIDDNYMTSQDNVFAAGDSQSGASLVVRAIAHGRKAAAAINEHLK